MRQLTMYRGKKSSQSTMRLAVFCYAIACGHALAFQHHTIRRETTRTMLAAKRLMTSHTSLASAISDNTEEFSLEKQAIEPIESRSRRGVRRLDKFARLPVWPVWSGVLIWLVGKVLGENVAARLEDQWTGRVCPNFFDYTETSPFVMLVHHCHSFAPWDPVRYIQRTFFPGMLLSSRVLLLGEKFHSPYLWSLRRISSSSASRYVLKRRGSLGSRTTLL